MKETRSSPLGGKERKRMESGGVFRRFIEIPESEDFVCDLSPERVKKTKDGTVERGDYITRISVDTRTCVFTLSPFMYLLCVEL